MEVTIRPWKSNLMTNCHCESGTKLIVVRMGTLAFTTFTWMALKHWLQSFLVTQAGKKEALTLRMTLEPKFTAPFEESWTWSGINFLHTLGLFDDPPLQNHPGSYSHLLLHPSPLAVFPSSHCCSYLIPSPQISSQLTIFCPLTFCVLVAYPIAQVLH